MNRLLLIAVFVLFGIALMVSAPIWAAEELAKPDRQSWADVTAILLTRGLAFSAGLTVLRKSRKLVDLIEKLGEWVERKLDG